MNRLNKKEPTPDPNSDSVCIKISSFFPQIVRARNPCFGLLGDVSLSYVSLMNVSSFRMYDLIATVQQLVRKE